MSDTGFLAEHGMTGYVMAAYALTWVVIVGYTLILTARGRRARAELEAEISKGGDE